MNVENNFKNFISIKFIFLSNCHIIVEFLLFKCLFKTLFPTKTSKVTTMGTTYMLTKLVKKVMYIKDLR